MKPARLLQAVSVIGAVLVGGTVTGTTTATWTDAATLPSGVVRSGFLGLNATATDLTVLGNGKSSTLHARVDLERFGAGRNLRATTLLTGVDSGGLTVDITPPNGAGTCRGVAEGKYTPWRGTSVPIIADEQVQEFTTPRSLCLKISSPTAWTTSPDHVALTFTARQLRDGRPVGWQASATVTVPTGLASRQPAAALAPPPTTSALTTDAATTDNAQAQVEEESSK